MSTPDPGTAPVDSSRFAEFRRRRHFGSLDGLRALSIIGVVWHHAARSNDLFFAGPAANGVPLFFAISGFLITSLLLREQSAHGDISLKDFYARRSLRIFPLYYAVLAVYAVIVWRAGEGASRGAFFHNLPYFATYTSNWFVRLDGHVIFYFSWSLATEEQFYLVWPTIEKVLSRYASAIALGVCALRFAVETALVPLAVGSFAYNVVLSVQPAICFGAVLAHALHSEKGFRALRRWLGAPYASPLLLIAMLASLGFDASLWVQHALMVLLVGACVVDEGHLLSRPLRSRALQSIGRASYGIYLLHMLVINAAERLLARIRIQEPFAVFVLAFLATWGVALVSLKYFEGFFLRKKTRFARA